MSNSSETQKPRPNALAIPASITSKKRKEFSDASVLPRLKSKDQKLITDIVERYTQDLYRAARGAGFHDPDASEIVQETFLTFVEKLDRFEGRSHVRTWLFGILFNKIYEARRHLSKKRREDDIDEVMETRFDFKGHWQKPPKDPEAFLRSSETMKTIQTCMDELPDQHRHAFHLKEVMGFSTEEICKILSVTTTHLGVILYRARNRLRECVEKEGHEKGETDA